MFCLSQFFASAAGSQLRRWEANQLDILLKGLHGEAALQIGVPYGPVMRSAPHRFKVVSTVTSEIKNIRTSSSLLRQSFTDFPFRDDSFDLILLVHVLERSNDFEQTLNETLRILAPEGRVVILGLNPWGPWWLRKNTRLFNDIYQPVSVDQIKKTLGDRAVIDRGRFGVYSPSLSDNPNRLMSWSWCEKAGDRWWPALANGFMLSAVKKVHSGRLVGRLYSSDVIGKNWAGTAAARTTVTLNIGPSTDHRDS